MRGQVGLRMYTMSMALHTTNPEVENEIRSLARERGQSITELVGAAVRVLRAQPEALPEPKPTVAELKELIHSFALTAVNYDLTEDEILGYGPNGYCE